MNETKHTPGPWEFRMYAGGCVIVSKHDAPGSSVRARLKGVTVKVDAVIYDDQSNAHEASPDARLIAAAPDLLEALEKALPIIEAEAERREEAPISQDQRVGYWSEMRDLANEFADTIDKATGGPK